MLETSKFGQFFTQICACLCAKRALLIETFYIVETSELNATSKCSRSLAYSRVHVKRNLLAHETFVGPFCSVRWPMAFEWQMLAFAWFLHPAARKWPAHLCAHIVCTGSQKFTIVCQIIHSRTFPSEPLAELRTFGWWQYEWEKGSAPNQMADVMAYLFLHRSNPFRIANEVGREAKTT